MVRYYPLSLSTKRSSCANGRPLIFALLYTFPKTPPGPESRARWQGSQSHRRNEGTSTASNPTATLLPFGFSPSQRYETDSIYTSMICDFSFVHAGLPVLYIILWSPTLMPYDEIKVPILPYIHLVAVLSPWVGSAIYHTFMNHHHGYRSVAQFLIQSIDFNRQFFPFLFS